MGDVVRRQYRHKKNGKVFISLAIAFDKTDLKNDAQVVIYHPQDNEHSIYTCALKEFGERFEVIE